MFSIPNDEKKLRSLISRYRSALRKEEKVHGFISDGSGKRYILFCLYFALDDCEKSHEYISWYEAKFFDDIGEPVQKLCWALILFRSGRLSEARFRAADLMLSNLYMIPFVLGKKVRRHRIWYGINFSEYEYILDTPIEILDSITNEEKEWLASVYDDPEIKKIRTRYIEISRELKDIKVGARRSALVNESLKLLKRVHF